MPQNAQITSDIPVVKTAATSDIKGGQFYILGVSFFDLLRVFSLLAVPEILNFQSQNTLAKEGAKWSGPYNLGVVKCARKVQREIRMRDLNSYFDHRQFSHI